MTFPMTKLLKPSVLIPIQPSFMFKITSSFLKPGIENGEFKLMRTRLIWTHGIQLWGAGIIYTNRIQRILSKMFRTISKAPFYVSNKSLHIDLKISTVTELA